MIYAGKRQAIDAYFSASKVLKMYLGDAEVYASKVAIVCTIDGAETTTTIGNGESLAKVLNPGSGKQIMPWTVTVEMGGVDISSSAYDAATNTVSIASVEANVEINAESVTMSSAYKPVEYLESPATASTSNGYFETGYKPTDLTEVEADIYITTLSSNSGIFGCNTNASPYFALMGRYSSSSYGRGWWGNQELQTSSFGNYVKPTTRQTIKMGKGSVTYIPNGSSDYVTKSFSSTTTTPWTSPNPLSFGGYKTGTSTVRAAKLRQHRFIIKEDGVVVRDYVPCYRVSDSINGFYDTKNGTFLTQPNGGSDWTLPT